MTAITTTKVVAIEVGQVSDDGKIDADQEVVKVEEDITIKIAIAIMILNGVIITTIIESDRTLFSAVTTQQVINKECHGGH